MGKSVKELREELKAAEKREEEEARRRKESVVPEFVYLVKRAEFRAKGWNNMLDSSVVCYYFWKEAKNQAECNAAGHAFLTGGIKYLFNTATGRLICHSGGGTLIIKEHGDRAADIIHRVNNFLVANPDGGVITELLVGQEPW